MRLPDFMTWQGVKADLGHAISNVVRGSGFLPVPRRHAWVRRVKDVHQLILLEKMRGDRVRFRVFVAADEKRIVGGELTRTSIGGLYGIGTDFFWPGCAREQLADSAREIGEVFEHTAMPWFDTIVDAARLEAAELEYPDIADGKPGLQLPARAGQRETVVHALPFRRAVDIDGLARKDLWPALEVAGFERFGASLCFLRRRADITDVVELVPVNHGVHAACFAYNWIAELSADDSGEFSSGSRVILVGGYVPLTTGSALNQKTVTLGNDQNAVRVLRELSTQLTNRNLPGLARVSTKEDFVAAVDPVHASTLSALGIRD